jgi:hypothetical protein
VAGVLGNKLVTIRGPLLPASVYISTYSFGVQLSYVNTYLSNLRSVPYKHHSGRQQYDLDSLTFVAEECEEEVV